MLRRAAPQLVRCLRTVQPCSQAPASSSWTLFGDLQPSSQDGALHGHRSFATAPDGEAGETASTVAEHASAIVEASTAAEASGLLAAAADVWAPTRAFLWTMAGIHDLDVPWWAAIAATSFAVRVATFPMTVLQQRKSGVMMQITEGSKQLQELQAATSRATTSGEYERTNRRFTEAMTEFKEKHKHDFKFAYMLPLFGIVNAAVFISQFNAIRELAKEVPSLAHGGALWFQDLTMPDPFFGLPIACTIMTLGMVELGVMSSEMNMKGQQAAIMKWVFRGVALVFIPASQYVSSAVAVLWCANSFLAIGQSLLLRNKRVRRVLSLPDMSQLAAQSADSKQGLNDLVARLTGKVQEVAAATSSQGTPAVGVAAIPGGAAVPRARASAAAAPAPGMRLSGLKTNKPPKKKR